ncbi:hypothetical protein HMPREF1977_1586 [Capnocytophaga ochracea F0287]|uniref:Baseplate structural protein Gp10 C-terminal domain-containing protein n=1 Tax=Capnocytophaga ochracea F0287 TaxID=873517 RepID=E4MT76_CAPOC|nr:hypothetical protein [Capnocytophaga ochracea]EFS97096.1 hypothetical protein HMPREF1977_1586 [Capnocytophaga ochracea F0287]EJF45178.1 hypothetical protein HMPREF1319_0055 [Capnocytophaga ochracea str. Holt 25]UEB42353.1 hypothetical protein LK419_05930 [Capnocytophaga ochracea]
MNSINVNQTGGFPLTTNVLSYMQNAYKIFNAMSGISGDLIILSGCEVVGNTVSDGVVAIEGEIYPFQGTTLGSHVFIKEVNTSKIFEDGSQKTVLVEKVATFGSSTKSYPWESFRRVLSNRQIEEKSFTEETSLLKRLEKLEERVKKTVPLGLVAIWGKPANIPLPEGWREYEPLRGRMAVGQDIADNDLGVIGRTGGEKMHRLTIAEMPHHNHQQGSESLYNSYGGGTYVGKRSWEYDDGTTYNTYSGQNTSSVGDDQPHNNMPPYRVIRFIEFVGF